MDLKNKLIEIYGESKHDIRIFKSPGRVNLIGEHIDYNGGYVFPAALTVSTTVSARKRDDQKIKILATDLDYVVEAQYDDLKKHQDIPWGNYQLGVAQELMDNDYPLTGCEMIFEDKVPLGSGLSSSAAIEIATGLALMALSGHQIDPIGLAKIAQKAEHHFVGVNCGIMDQFASAMGQKDHAILLNTKTMDFEHIPIQMFGYKLVISNTNKKRSLGDSKYNERRRECEQALKCLQKPHPDITALCDLPVSDFEKDKHVIQDPIIQKRAKHAVWENQRVLAGVEALKNKDLRAFGQLMNQSHISLRDDYEVSCKELDTLVDLAWKAKGVLGSRMTGAGFGGCTVSIVQEGQIHSFIQNVGQAYEEIIGHKADFYISEIGDGGMEVT